jgi:hypothetical protein
VETILRFGHQRDRDNRVVKSHPKQIAFQIDLFFQIDLRLPAALDQSPAVRAEQLARLGEIEPRKPVRKR